MAFTSKDGSRFTNHSTMKQHEARVGSRMAGKGAKPGASSAMASMPGDASQDDGMGGMDADQQDGAAMAQEHGPAVQLEVSHEGGGHSVHAMHPDGHAHDSEHESAAAAHKYAADCAGCGMGGDAE